MREREYTLNIRSKQTLMRHLLRLENIVKYSIYGNTGSTFIGLS